MSNVTLRADEREPGLGLSLLAAAALVLGLFIAGGLQFITPAAKEAASLPVEVEVSLEPAPPAREKSPIVVSASAVPAPHVAEPDPAPKAEAAPTQQPELEVPPFAGLMAVSAETASVADPKPVEVQVEAVNPAPTPEVQALAAWPAAPSSLPGNMDLMPAPQPINRLNPLAAGMPMPARPTPAEALPTEGEGLSSAQDAPDAGAAAPELQVTSATGQDGEGFKPSNGIKVTLLINYLGEVEGVEIIEGSPDRAADVLIAQGMKQRRFKFNPPIPRGQRVLRTYYIPLSAEALP